MGRKKTIQQFKEELFQINPNITVLGTYENTHTGILCKCNKCMHEWNPQPADLLSGKGCPKCSKVFKRTEAEFLEELSKNNSSVRYIYGFKNMGTKVFVQCKKCGRKWDADPYRLLHGGGCKYCKRRENDLRRRLPQDDFCERVDKLNPNIKILGEYTISQERIQVQCKRCGHIWNPIANSLLMGTGCPVCAGKQNKKHETFEMEMRDVNPNIEIIDKYINAKTKIKYRCRICGNEDFATPNKLLQGQGCSRCNFTRHTSFFEQAIYFYCKQCFADTINSYSELGYELDVYIPSLRTAIEYDGVYWHKSKIDKDNDKDKACIRDGIRLIRIRDYGLDETSQAINILRSFEHDTHDFEQCLSSLFNILNVNPDINVERDRTIILEQYKSIVSKNSFECEYPELAKWWDYSRNGSLMPSMFTSGSGVTVWWICPICKKSRQAKILDIKHNGVHCKKCAMKINGAKQRKTNEEFVSELFAVNPTIKALEPYATSKDGIKVQCKICGNVWVNTPGHLLAGEGCRKCSNARVGSKLRKTNEQFLKELNLKVKTLIPQEEYQGASVKINFYCTKCHEIWNVRPADILNHNRTCPNCKKKRN